MKTLDNVLAAMVLAVWLSMACGPQPAPPLVPTDGPWPPTPEGACYALAALGCAESKPAADGSSCPTVIRKAQRLVDMRLHCIVEASSVATVRACGSVRCRD